MSAMSWNIYVQYYIIEWNSDALHLLVSLNFLAKPEL